MKAKSLRQACALLIAYGLLTANQTTVAYADLSVDDIAALNELFLRSAEWADHYREFKEAGDQFFDAAHYAAQADQGVRPTPPDSRWEKLTSNYDSASKKMASEQLATDFDETPFIVSWTDWRGCHTREHAIEVLRQYSEALGNAAARGEDDLTRYADYHSEVIAIQTAVDTLQRILEKHISDFQLVIGFEMDWLALNNQVKPSLIELRDVIEKKQKQLSSAVKLVRTRKSNLDGNLAQLISNECSLAGNWSGTIAIEGENKPITTEISGDPGNYKITYSIDGRRNANFCLIAISANERRLDFRPSCSAPANSLRFSLSFAASFTSLTGIETDGQDADVRYPIAMTRR